MSPQPPMFLRPEPQKSKVKVYFFVGVALLAAAAFWYVETYSTSTPPVAPPAVTAPANPPG